MSRPMRCRYSDESKERAVALSQSNGYIVAEAARRLGINRTMLDRWRRQLADAGQANSPVDDRDDELRRLREENRQLREERTILKNRLRTTESVKVVVA